LGLLLQCRAQNVVTVAAAMDVIARTVGIRAARERTVEAAGRVVRDRVKTKG
jgi:hypothetical protein